MQKCGHSTLLRPRAIHIRQRHHYRVSIRAICAPWWTVVPSKSSTIA